MIILGVGAWLVSTAHQTYGPYGDVRRVNCMSNLKTIAKGMLLYAEDNDGRLVPKDEWMDRLLASGKGYLPNESILCCPCFPTHDTQSRYGYAYNSELSGRRMAAYELPEHTPLVFESSNWDRNVSDPLTSFPGPYRPEEAPSARANIAYLSGHVERSVKE